MNKSPLVSIIIPLFNRVNFIEETLSSLRAQTFPNWEVILVDDGSTDGSFEFVSKVSKYDSRIRVYQRQRLPKGASTCRNIGAELSNGQYLVFLDSDDLLAPFCLQRRIDIFEKNQDCDFIAFAMYLFNHHPYDLKIYYNIDKEEDDLKRFISFDALWQTMGPIYNKTFFLQTGGFDESLPYRQDYEYHLRVLTSKPKYLKKLNLEPDCFLRKHEAESISQSNVHAAKKIKVKRTVFLKTLKTMVADTVTDWSSYYPIFTPMMMETSLEWVKYHLDLDNALHTWQKYYDIGTLNYRDYRFGKRLIKARYNKLKQPSIYSKFLSKLYTVRRPKHFIVQKNTLCKLKETEVLEIYDKLKRSTCS